MHHSTVVPARRRVALAALGAILMAASIAACGSSAPASTAPSVAPTTAPTIAPSVAPSEPVVPSSAPSGATGSAGTGVDAAAGLSIDPPYSLTALPGALQTTFEQQMATGLGGFAGTIDFGFRQVAGGTGISILMVIGFPAGSLNDIGYQAALAGMGSSMGATFETTTVDGVEVSNGKATAGGVAVFHVADHMLVVISQSDTETLAIAKALVGANQ